MNKHLALVAVFFALFSAAASAQQVSCDELIDIANSLDRVADAFSQDEGTIVEGGYIDKALDQITDSISVIADSENEPDLSRGASKLGMAWDNMDDAGFQRALDDVIRSLDRLFDRDC